LVNPLHPPTDREAVTRSVGGASVLEKATVYSDLPSALHGCRLVIGTSRRTGRRRDLIPIGQVDTLLEGVLPRQRIAMLFGSEEKGLTNDELSLCQSIVTIPTGPKYASLNLAHSVAVVAYALRNATHPPAVVTAKAEPQATPAQMQQMFEHLEESLAAIGFFPYSNPTNIMRQLRNLFRRSQLTEQEVRLLRGIARQTLWKSSQK
jgi:tRNA/rRNA methyltransferase